MLRTLVALACLLALAHAGTPRVKFFPAELRNRAEAIEFCQNKNMFAAHIKQLILDYEEGNGENHKDCGFVDFRNGPIHGFCEEHESDGVHCKPGKFTFKTCTSPEKLFGAYCHPKAAHSGAFKVYLGQLSQLFRLPGPFQKLSEAMDACEELGASLASWMQAAKFAERYSQQFCEYNILRVKHAVYRVNCENSRRINWQVWHRERRYGAICVGLPPHKFKNPCSGEERRKRENNEGLFPALLGAPVTCEDGWIIVQQRPSCEREAKTGNVFSGKSRHNFVEGFGKGTEPWDGYWFGLERLHRLTTDHDCELQFQVTLQNGTRYRAFYRTVEVGPGDHKDERYTLHVADYDEEGSNAGDMMNKAGYMAMTENGSPFSDPEHDFDRHPTANCAGMRYSGWWHGACSFGDINGLCPGEEHYNPEKHQYRQWDYLTFDKKEGLLKTKMLVRCRESS